MISINIMDSSLIGVYATCTDDICLVPYGCDSKTIEEIKKELNVNIYKCLINNSVLVGSLCKGNTNGLIVSDYFTSKILEKITKKKIILLNGKMNAIGNIMLLNDNACLIHPNTPERYIEKIKRNLKVDVLKGTIGNIKNVGMAGYVTNNGIIVNSKVNDEELYTIEKLFQMKPKICTVNFGSFMIGSAVLSNKYGCITGKETTGYEFGQIIKGLGFIN